MATTTAPATPKSQILQAPTSTPSPGSWRHPQFDEITRRQKANTFNDSNLRRIAWNGGALVALLLASSYPWFQALSHYLQPLATPMLLGLCLLALYNLATAFLPLIKTKDELTDIALTPAQRALLGLDPNATPPPTPGTKYITPPRYPRSPTPRTISPANRNNSNYSTPSPSSGKERGDSPAASPLWQKATSNARDPARRSSYGSPSPLGPGFGGRDGSILGAPSTPSPTGRGATVGLNSKWLYDKGRSSSGSRSMYTGSSLYRYSQKWDLQDQAFQYLGHHQAMLIMEPLEPANVVDISADLSTPFEYLTNSDTDAGQR